jgi:hypothetical protein
MTNSTRFELRVVPKRGLTLLFFLCLAILAFSNFAYGNDVDGVQSRIDARAAYTVPEGWDLEVGTDVNNPVIYIRKGYDTIRIILLGGKNSHWATPEDYIKLPGTTMGHPPKKIAKIKVADIETWLYEIGIPINLGDPHWPPTGTIALGKEQYCIIPASEKYFVLSCSCKSAIPDPNAVAEETWKSFLKAFRLRK